MEGKIGISRVETQPVTQLGESKQATMTGKTPATAAGTIPAAAMLQMATRTGELGPTMDPRAMPTITKAGTHKARTAIVLREEMRIMGKAGISRVHAATVLSGEMRAMAKPGTKKAQLTIVLTGQTLGADLQDPGQRLTTHGLQAMLVVDGAREIIPTTVLQALCQALGKIIQALRLDSIAGLTSLRKAGTSLVMATLPLQAAAAVLDGVGLLHLKDHHFPFRVVTMAGEEEATKVEVQQATGTPEVEAQEVHGTKTHPTTLDRPPIRGRRTSPVIPKVRQRIGSGSTGVGLGILPVMGMATGDDRDCDASMRSVGAVGTL